MKRKNIVLTLQFVALSLFVTYSTAFSQDSLKQKKMLQQDYTTSFLTDKSPQIAFAAINNVRGWWSEEITGHTDRLNAEFNYHFQDVHRCELKIVEFVPDKKVVWLVKHNYFNFTKDKTEWTGTRMVFELTEKDGKTEVRFTHQGLVPTYECYDICKDAWTSYIQTSLSKLISTGKGLPNASGKPRTENEKKLSGGKK